MQYLVTKAQMKAYDRATIEETGIPSLVLMERAACSTAEEIIRRFPEGSLPEKTVLVLAGCGNNGGDGIAAARLLLAKGCEVRAFLVGDRGKMTPDSLAMEQKLILAGGILEYDLAEQAALQEWMKGSACMVDALFGVGLRRPITGDFLWAVRRMNEAPCPVVACDIPSGIDGDTGVVLGEAVRAAWTVTFTCSKY